MSSYDPIRSKGVILYTLDAALKHVGEIKSLRDEYRFIVLDEYPTSMRLDIEESLLQEGIPPDWLFLKRIDDLRYSQEFYGDWINDIEGSIGRIERLCIPAYTGTTASGITSKTL